jgi:hypothetical protein
MKIFSSRKRVAAIGVVTAATLVGGGMAYAYWTTTGSGTGEAAVGTSNATVTVTQGSLLAMYPGDAPQDLVLTVTNNSSTQNAYVGALTATITTDKGGCTYSDFKINGVEALATTPLIWTGTDIAKGGFAVNSANKIQFNNTNADQDACQGAAVEIAYAAS